jgi:hypothetical protein
MDIQIKTLDMLITPHCGSPHVRAIEIIVISFRQTVIIAQEPDSLQNG